MEYIYEVEKSHEKDGAYLHISIFIVIAKLPNGGYLVEENSSFRPKQFKINKVEPPRFVKINEARKYAIELIKKIYDSELLESKEEFDEITDNFINYEKYKQRYGNKLVVMKQELKNYISDFKSIKKSEFYVANKKGK